jgi:hypothetical protein
MFIVFNMLFGLVLLQESQFYDARELISIGATSAISVLGIYILVQKQKQQVEK